MLVQPTQDEGASSERLSVEQPSPSPAPTGEIPNESLPDSSSAQPSEVPFEQQPEPSPSPSPRPSPTPIVHDTIPEPSGENFEDHSSNDASLSGNEDDMTLQNVYDLCISLCQQVSDQAKEIKLLKAKITKLKKQAKPVIQHYKEYLKSISLRKRFPRKSSSKKARVHRKNVSKQGRKKAKGESSVQRDPMFEVLAEDNIDHMETENAQTEGRTRDKVDEEKEFDEERLSTEDEVSTVKERVSTDFEKVSTDKSKVSTDAQREGTEESNESTEEIFEGTEEQRESTEDKLSTDEQMESTEDQPKEENASKASHTSTQSPTSMTFGDDETIATLLLNMSKAKAASKEKEKGVELKDVEEIDRPRPTSTRSLLTLKPLPKIDPKDKGKKKIEEEVESESEDDDIPQAVKKFKQLESDEEMARKIQEEWEAEEERNKIAEEKATNEALIKNFDDIKARIEADRILAEKLQEQEREQFTIEERAKFLHDTIAAQRKFLARQRSEKIRNRPPTKNQLRNQMMTFLKHVGNFKHSELKSKKFEDIQAMYEKIKRSDEDFIAIGSVEDDRLINKMKKKDSSKEEEIKQESKVEVKEEDKGEENIRKRKHNTRKKMKSRKRRFKQDTSQDDPSDIEKENDELRLCLTIAPDEDKEVDYEILDKKSNGQKRSFSTLIRVLSVFDREDLDAVYKLVMDIYQDKIPEGFDKVLWGDLIVMFNPDEQDEFWNSQHEWKVVSWKLHSSSGVHTLMTDEGLVVHMLIEKKYPLKKEILMQMLKLKLESEEESTMALELIRFIKKSWLVQDQTVLGKDYSNLLIADSLLKTIWFINAPCYDNEALASPNTNDEELSIPEQTATGKGTSNPLMAGSLPKTTKPTWSRTERKKSIALVTVDGECVDLETHSEDDENYAFMASNSSGSNTQVTSCSNECKESYANLKRLYDVQREELSDASVEIKAYTQGLKKVEAQLVAHQQGQLWYEQKIKFMKIDLDDKTDVLTYHKTLLAKAQKEKDDLEVIVDKWNHSSKNLGKMINDHMSASDKFGLGYGDYRYSGNLSYENEISQSVFKCNKSDSENLPLHKRLAKTCEMQAVPPPMTRNYFPSGPDIEIDDSQYTYGPEKTQSSESESQTTEIDTCNSNISIEPSELVSEPVVNESNIEVQPKVWSDAPIIEEYESDSDNKCVTVQTKGLDTPSFANKQVKTPRENVKNQSTHSQKPKVNNKELGHGFTER
ncbi:hypothetical protein Tco_0449930, partial [Tanacetum coccineum]